jgi:DNA modification methylase
MSTELVWEGKYDEYGSRREVDVAGSAFPMQRIETIDQPRSEAAASGQLAMFEKKIKRLDDFRNRLIWGDNKLVMASLLKEFKGQVDLIYIDPPYDVGADFTCDVVIGDEDEDIEKDQSTLEMVAYRDTWGRGTDSYLQMMSERLLLMRELLSDRGSIFLHCDWHVGHFVRALLDQVFGRDAFVNEIVWYYYNKLHDSRKKLLPRAHDVIFRYCKIPGQQIHSALSEPRDEPVKKLKYKKVAGKIQNIIGPDGKAVTYESTTRTVDDVWRIRCLQPVNKEEYTKFRTQKPVDLVSRIIDLASTEDSIVFDAFCGTGTTAVAAERAGRRWLACDLGRFSVHTSRKRLIDTQRTLHDKGAGYRAFDLYNLGRYERQWWQKDALRGADDEHRRLVLEFFRAEILTNASSPLLHGRKAGAFCHVDGIDSMFSRDEARELARAVAAAGGTECFCLAWEFEMDLRLTTAALQQEIGVKLKLIQIPREIMERNRKGPPPFLEMAVLEAEPVYRGKGAERQVDIKLSKFLPSLAEVPTKELEALQERAIKSGFDFIDFWAIDFDWHPDRPFAHHWQDYRTRKDRSLKTVSDAAHTYPESGTYTACVKVVDVFGADTSISIEVKA